MPLPRFLASLIRTRLVAPAPVIAPIAPALLSGVACWQLQLDCPAAFATLRRLIDQDLLRWLDRQPTYLPSALLLAVEKHLPHHPGVVPLGREQWVALSHALVTYQIFQEQLRSVPLLADGEPGLILSHLAQLRSAARVPLP